MDLGKGSSHPLTTPSISKKSSKEGGEKGGDKTEATATALFFYNTLPPKIQAASSIKEQEKQAVYIGKIKG
jgi:hypothetical protein